MSLRIARAVAKRLAQDQYGWRKPPNPLRPLQWYCGNTEHADNIYASLGVKLNTGHIVPIASAFYEDELTEDELKLDEWELCENPAEWLDLTSDQLAQAEDAAREVLAGGCPNDGEVLRFDR